MNSKTWTCNVVFVLSYERRLKFECVTQMAGKMVNQVKHYSGQCISSDLCVDEGSTLDLFTIITISHCAHRSSTL